MKFIIYAGDSLHEKRGCISSIENKDLTLMAEIDTRPILFKSNWFYNNILISLAKFTNKLQGDIVSYIISYITHTIFSPYDLLLITATVFQCNKQGSLMLVIRCIYIAP